MTPIDLSQLLADLVPGIKGLQRRTETHTASKHVNNRGFRATKAYADDRQKPARNRRRFGRRKRKRYQ